MYAFLENVFSNRPVLCLAGRARVTSVRPLVDFNLLFEYSISFPASARIAFSIAASTFGQFRPDNASSSSSRKKEESSEEMRDWSPRCPSLPPYPPSPLSPPDRLSLSSSLLLPFSSLSPARFSSPPFFALHRANTVVLYFAVPRTPRRSFASFEGSTSRSPTSGAVTKE